MICFQQQKNIPILIKSQYQTDTNQLNHRIEVQIVIKHQICPLVSHLNLIQ